MNKSVKKTFKPDLLDEQVIQNNITATYEPGKHRRENPLPGTDGWLGMLVTLHYQGRSASVDMWTNDPNHVPSPSRVLVATLPMVSTLDRPYQERVDKKVNETEYRRMQADGRELLHLFGDLASLLHPACQERYHAGGQGPDTEEF